MGPAEQRLGPVNAAATAARHAWREAAAGAKCFRNALTMQTMPARLL
jgi:hypothetical protein